MKLSPIKKLKADKSNPAHVGSTIPGTVSQVFVKEGEEVKQNQPLLVLEAMKLETTVVAKQDGVIDKIYVAAGDRVNTAICCCPSRNSTLYGPYKN